MSAEQPKPNGSALERHAQTALVMLLVALLLWVGSTVQRTQITVAQVQTELRFMQQKLNEPNTKFKEIEKRLDSIEQQLNSIKVGQATHENNKHTK